MHLISTRGGERATQGAGGKLVTRDGKTHVVWQDSVAPALPTPGNVPRSDGYLNQVRTYDHARGTFSPVVTLNKGLDNHARPNICMGHDGTLHVVISGHGTPVTYRRSLRPNDSSAWTEPEIVGSGTYPVPVCAPDGTLYVLMRSAERWNGADLYCKPVGEPWHQACKLVYRDPEMPGYAAFHGGPAVDADETVHVVVNAYEGQGTMDRRGLYQAICYMQSADRGKTWSKADGTPVQVPARPEQMDLIARDRAEVRVEAMPVALFNAAANLALDGQGCPHILYVDHRRGPGQIVHASADASGQWSWNDVDTGIVGRVYPGFRPIEIRGAAVMPHGAMVAPGGEQLVAFLVLQRYDDWWRQGLPTRAMNMSAEREQPLAWLVSLDGGKSWSAQPAIDAPHVNSPSFEKPTGGNQLPAGGDQPPASWLPPFVFFDGASRYPEEGEIIQNNVYLVLP